MSAITWTMLILLFLALVFTIGSAAGKLPLWPAVLFLVIVQFLAGRPLPGL
jgi:hypothetical protein